MAKGKLAERLARSEQELQMTREALLRSTDQLGEVVAALHAAEAETDAGAPLMLALDTLTTLWRLRWELGELPQVATGGAS